MQRPHRSVPCRRAAAWDGREAGAGLVWGRLGMDPDRGTAAARPDRASGRAVRAPAEGPRTTPNPAALDIVSRSPTLINNPGGRDGGAAQISRRRYIARNTREAGARDSPGSSSRTLHSQTAVERARALSMPPPAPSQNGTALQHRAVMGPSRRGSNQPKPLKSSSVPRGQRAAARWRQ